MNQNVCSKEILSSVIGNPEQEKTDYSAYRIPGIIVTKKGTVIAYWESRNYEVNRKGQGNGDECLMDLFLRRSTDGGETFGESIFLAKGQEYYDKGYGETLNNLVLFVTNTDRLQALFCCDVGQGGLWNMYSDDDGLTWSQPKNIAHSLRRHPWDKLGFGPGHGICLRHGANAGRLIVPAWMWSADLQEEGNNFTNRITTVYSDDNGETWQMGEIASDNHDETCIVELSDGSVMLNSRQYSFPYGEQTPPRTEEQAYRAVTVSKNGVDGWSETRFDKTLIDPACEGNICSAEVEGLPRVILFSNCASKTKRFDLTVRCSLDDGRTWLENPLLLSPIGWYSDIAVDERTGVVYVLHENSRPSTGWKYMCMELFRFPLGLLLSE